MTSLDIAPARTTAVALAVAVAFTSWLALSAERQRVVVTETETTILDVVEFMPGTAALRATSKPTLDAVAATLRGNPSILRLEVQSHTSGIGNGVANQALSDQRAAAVARYLIDAGIAPSRLVAAGYGDTQPIARGAPSKNERVSFLILERSSDRD